MLIVGLLSVLVGVVQVFAPSLADGVWVARSGLEGRAVGNLRQPNHLSTLLLWSAVALVPLMEASQIRRRVVVLLFALLVFGIARWRPRIRHGPCPCRDRFSPR